MHSAMTELYTLARANEVAKKLPARPLRNRWGSVTDADRSLLRIGYYEVPAAFRLAYCSGAQPKAPK